MKPQTHITFLMVMLSAGFLVSCNAKTKPDKPVPITFNKFEIGTTADSIIYALGFKPDKRTDSKLEFRDVTFEGVRVDAVIYNVPGGRLTGGMFTLHEPKAGNYDTLYNRYLSRYGKPAPEVNGIVTWESNEATLNLMRSKENTLAVIMDRKTPNR